MRFCSFAWTDDAEKALACPHRGAPCIIDRGRTTTESKPSGERIKMVRMVYVRAG